MGDSLRSQIEATLLCGANPAVLVLARDIHEGANRGTSLIRNSPLL